MTEVRLELQPPSGRRGIAVANRYHHDTNPTYLTQRINC
jgi:hypothetical protein